MTVMRKVLLLLTDPQRINLQLRSYPQLYGAFKHLSAHCFGFLAHSFTVLYFWFLVIIVEHVAAKEPDIFLRGWWRPKKELKESEYWACIRNMTPNEW